MGTAVDRIWKVHGDGRSVEPGEVVRSFLRDGVATTLSGLFGGSGTTTYAETSV
jgi:xanthine/uracil permease